MVDFEAAFDRIPPASLILQAMKMGIKGRMLRFVDSFLQDRTIKTKINNTTSEAIKINNGVPQGSVLSPTLFNIMMHDIGKLLPVEVKYSMYADDLTVWTVEVDPKLATQLIQKAVTSISIWAQKWSMKISSEKTECTLFTTKYSLKEYKPEILLFGKNIKYNPHPKILGVTLDEKLIWKKHIETVTDKSLMGINLLKAVAGRCWGGDTVTLRQLYISYILPKVTYACEAWGGAAPSHKKKLDVIQNSALRLCLGCPFTTPKNALEIELNVEPLNTKIDKRIWIKFLKNQTFPNSHPSHHIVSTGNKHKQSFSQTVYRMCQGQDHLTPEERPFVNCMPPWAWTPPNVFISLPGDVTKTEIPEFLKQVTLRTIEENYNDHLHIYTDGSLCLNEGLSGAGYYVPKTGEKYYVTSSSGSSLDTELLAISAALQHCLSLEYMKICILTDSKSALQTII